MTTAVIEFPPLLVVEIVSPGNADDDYRYKRSEYAESDIHQLKFNKHTNIVLVFFIV